MTYSVRYQVCSNGDPEGMCMDSVKDYIINIDPDDLKNKIKIDHYSDKFVYPSKSLKENLNGRYSCYSYLVPKIND